MGHLGKILLVLVAFLLLMGSAERTYGDTFNMTWSGTYGPGSATLTATNEGSGQFLVTMMTGTQNGTAITGLLAPGVYANDNLIFPTSTPQLDLAGVSFNEGATDFNLFFFYSFAGGPNKYVECSSVVCPDVTYALLSTPLTSFDITPTPEPNSLGLLCLGLAWLAVLGFRKGSGSRYSIATSIR